MNTDREWVSQSSSPTYLLLYSACGGRSNFSRKHLADQEFRQRSSSIESALLCSITTSPLGTVNHKPRPNCFQYSRWQSQPRENRYLAIFGDADSEFAEVRSESKLRSLRRLVLQHYEDHQFRCVVREC